MDLSWRKGNLYEPDVSRCLALIKATKLPVLPPAEMTLEHFKELMVLDKKVLDGSLRLVLLGALGDAIITSDFPMSDFDDCIIDALEASEQIPS